MDLRERLVHTVEGGMSVRKAACQLMIDYSSALKWMRQFRRKGNVQPKRQGGYRKSVLLPHTRWLLQHIEQKPDQTLVEIRQSLIQKGVRVGIATLWRFFQRHQISFKKR
jgi:transposase